MATFFIILLNNNKISVLSVLINHLFSILFTRLYTKSSTVVSLSIKIVYNKYMKKPWRFWVRSGIYYVQFRSDPGKWVSCNTRDPESAERFAMDNCPEIAPETKVLFKHIAGNFYITGKCTWLKRQEERGISYRQPHIDKCRGLLENYLIPRFGNHELGDLTRRMIDDWLLTLKTVSQRTKAGHDIKNKILATFRHVMREAVDRGYIERDPSEGLAPFRPLTEVRKEIFTMEELHILFPIDIEAMLDIWLTLDWATYFFLQASAGLRPGEVGALTWGSWLRRVHGLVVSQAIENPTGLTKETKTKNIKPIPLVPRAEELLLLLESSKEYSNQGNRIFSAKDGGPVKLDSAAKRFHDSLIRAGLEPRNRTPYSFRHSFDTHAMKVLGAHTVKDLMGHKTLKHTMDTYYHPTDEDRINSLPKDAWEGLGKMWGGN